MAMSGKRNEKKEKKIIGAQIIFSHEPFGRKSVELEPRNKMAIEKRRQSAPRFAVQYIHRSPLGRRSGVSYCFMIGCSWLHC